MISSSVAAAVNVILNYFGIQIFGYMAAAYTTLIAYIILAVMQGIVSTKIHRQVVKDSVASVYDVKYIYTLAAATVASCTACILLYQFTILRYLIIVFMCAVVVKFRNKIIAVFMKK